MEVSRLGNVEPCHAGWPHCDFIHPAKLLDGSADSAGDGKQLHMAIACPCLAPTATLAELYVINHRFGTVHRTLSSTMGQLLLYKSFLQLTTPLEIWSFNVDLSEHWWPSYTATRS